MGVCTNPVKVLDFAFHAFPTLCPSDHSRAPKNTDMIAKII